MTTPTSSTWSLAAWAIAAVAMASSATSSRAEPGDFVFQPYAAPGSMAVQYTGGVEKSRDGSSEQAHSLALAASPTSRWFTAAYVGWYREPGEALRYSELSWVNHLQVTTLATSPAALGLYMAIERPRDRSEGYGVTWGPTFQFDTAHMQLNLNLWFDKDIHAADSGPAVLNYQWQAKSLVRPNLEWGVQGFGSVGAWNHWAPADEQEHTLGPAIFAKWPMQDGHVIRIDSAVLAGLSAASPRYTVQFRTLYQF